MRCQLKAKAAVQCRIAQRNHRGVAKLVQGIESFIDQLTRQALPPVVFIHRERRHADPLQIFTLNIDRAERDVTHYLTFIIGSNQTQR